MVFKDCSRPSRYILSKERKIRAETVRKTRPVYPMPNPAAINAEAAKRIFSVLHEKDIRLVTIHPGSSDQIRCEIEVTALGDSPLYSALSYVWGTHHEDKLIYLNGEKFYVRKNLKEALQGLRRADQAVVFWIDALCINQFDDDEKNAQIPLMADLYKHAQKVVAFLGPHDKTSPLLFEKLQQIEAQHYSMLQIMVSTVSDGVDHLQDAMEDITQREYWTRAWIVQEFMCGSQNRKIQCGDDEVSFLALEELMETKIMRAIVVDLPKAGGPDVVAKSACLTKWHSRFARFKDKELSADGYLESFLESQCSRPQDHIYAFYSLFPKALQAHINVDVRKEPQEIACQLAQGIIKETKSLHIMTLRGRQVKPLESWQYCLPLWCSFFGVKFLNDPIGRENGIPRRFNNDVEDFAIFSEDGRQLEVKGIVIGEICEILRKDVAVQSISEFGFQDDSRTEHEWKYFRKCIQFIKLPSHNDTYLDRSVLDDVIEDDPFSQENLVDVLKAQVSWRDFKSKLEENAELQSSWRTFSKFFHSRQISNFQLDGSIVNQEHQAICSSKGTIPVDLAIIPETARFKDVVCAIHRCESLMILRKKGKCYNVVGEAMVYDRESWDILAFLGSTTLILE